jgi:hypothetical protein
LLKLGIKLVGMVDGKVKFSRICSECINGRGLLHFLRDVRLRA